MGVIGQRDLGLHGRGMLLVIVSIVFTITSILLVIMRASSRLIIGRHLGKDDYTIMVSLVGFSELVTMWRSEGCFRPVACISTSNSKIV